MGGRVCLGVCVCVFVCVCVCVCVVVSVFLVEIKDRRLAILCCIDLVPREFGFAVSVKTNYQYNFVS